RSASARARYEGREIPRAGSSSLRPDASVQTLRLPTLLLAPYLVVVDVFCDDPGHESRRVVFNRVLNARRKLVQQIHSRVIANGRTKSAEWLSGRPPPIRPRCRVGGHRSQRPHEIGSV